MKKVCAHWVPRVLTPEQRERRSQNCQELLTFHKKDPERFFAKVVTGDEFWFHHQIPEMKSQSVQLKRHDSPGPKKFQTVPFAGKQVASVGGGCPVYRVASTGAHSEQ
jgi:hypothetical protein